MREDLIGFGIPEDFEWIKSRSEFSFKKLVKVKATEFALGELNHAKGSKMEKTFHGKLVMQSYLKLPNMTPDDGKMVFAFRTRMANFSENFRGQSDPKQCPLCQTHLDNQQMAFNCPQIKPKLNPEGKYDGIYKTELWTKRASLTSTRCWEPLPTPS